MNKSQLISSIAECAELTLTKAEKALAAAIDGIVESLAQGKEVSLIGFGRFGVKLRAARKVRNPQTGKEMMIKPAVVPFFKAGKGLKETVDVDPAK
jgi:DNA-binding protein HU-beta